MAQAQLQPHRGQLTELGEIQQELLAIVLGCAAPVV